MWQIVVDFGSPPKSAPSFWVWGRCALVCPPKLPLGDIANGVMHQSSGRQWHLCASLLKSVVLFVCSKYSKLYLETPSVKTYQVIIKVHPNHYLTAHWMMHKFIKHSMLPKLCHLSCARKKNCIINWTINRRKIAIQLHYFLSSLLKNSKNECLLFQCRY